MYKNSEKKAKMRGGKCILYLVRICVSLFFGLNNIVKYKKLNGIPKNTKYMF